MKRNLFSSFVLILVFGFSTAVVSALTPPAPTVASGEEIYEQNKRGVCTIITTFVYDVPNPMGKMFDKIEHTRSIHGTGSFIDGHGNILTVAHCVTLENVPEGKFTIKKRQFLIAVLKPDGSRKIYEGKLIGTNKSVDLAIIQAMNIKESDYAVIDIGNSDDLRAGQMVYAIASPIDPTLYGSFWTASIGFVNRNVGNEAISYRIQLDRSAASGNSGGPILNSDGKIVGIIQLALLEKMSFAIPVNLAKVELLKKGNVLLPSIGLTLLDNDFPRFSSKENFEEGDFFALRTILPGTPDEKLRKIALMSIGRSALITSIERDELKKKILVGDIVLSADGIPTKTGMDLKVHLLGRNPGETITLSIFHINTEKTTEEKIVLSEK